MEKIIGIYKIENLINGKVYIGQSWDCNRRWAEHKYNLKYNSRNKTHLYSAMIKYGINNFTFEIIKEIQDDTTTQFLLDSLEDYYILKYCSTNSGKGYNKRGGGSRGRLLDETKNKLRSKNLGKHPSSSTKARMSESHLGLFSKNKGPLAKKVICLDTSIIFNSIVEAADAVQACRSAISKCCRGIITSAGGLRWSYYKSEVFDVEKQFGKIRRVISLDTKEEYCSIREASRQTNVSACYIKRCCQQNIYMEGKSKWSYVGEIYEEPTLLKFYNSKKIICINTNIVYNSIMEASRITKINKSSIRDCLHNRSTYGGKDTNGNKLYWKYFKE